MLQSRTSWQDNYKSMSHARLVQELEQIAKRPYIYPDHVERKAFIAGELAIKPTTPIIVLEAD